MRGYVNMERNCEGDTGSSGYGKGRGGLTGSLGMASLEVLASGRIFSANESALKLLDKARTHLSGKIKETLDESEPSEILGENVIDSFVDDVFSMAWGDMFRNAVRDVSEHGGKKSFTLTVFFGECPVRLENTVLPVMRHDSEEDIFLVILETANGSGLPKIFLQDHRKTARGESGADMGLDISLPDYGKINVDIIDSDFNVRYVDEEWKKIYGDPTGRMCYNYFMDRTEPCPGCGLRKAFQMEKPFVTEQNLVKEGGRAVQVTTIPLQDEKGEWLLVEINTDITGRKKMREDFQRVNTFLDSIVENIPNMIFIKDARELKFIRFNRAGEELLGYSREELIGRNDYDFFPREQADFFIAKDRETLSRGGTVDIEEENIDTKYKGKRFLHTKKVPIRNDKGEPEFLLGISEDITERKKAEDALLESQKRFRALVANVPGVVFRCSCDEYRTMRFLSKGIEELAGYPGEDIIDNSRIRFNDIIHEEDRSRVGETVSRCVSEGKPFQMDYRLVTASGDIVWVRENGRGVSKEEDAPPAFVDGVIVDITLHVKAEEEIRCQWGILSNLMDNIPFFVFWKDRSAVYLGCNRAFAEVSGVGHPENVRGKTDHELAWREEEANFYRHLDFEVMQNGEPALNVEETQLQAGDKETVILSSRVPLRDGNGDVAGVLGIYADITEQKEKEKRLRLFKDLMDQSSDILFIVEASTGKFLDTNHQAITMLGYSSEEFLGMKVSDVEPMVFGEQDIWEFFQEIKASGGSVVRGEYLMKNGQSVPVEINAKYVEFGEDAYVVVVARDITERLIYENKLKDSERKYRTIFENTGTITAIVDDDMSIVMANSEFRKFFGFDPDAGDTGKKMDTLVCPEDRQSMESYHRLRRIDPESAPHEYEIGMIDVNGRVRSTHVTVALIPGTGKTVLSFLDLTDLRAKEFELAKQRDLLDSTNKALEHKIKELNEALGHIRKLEGLVPICSSCKKIMKSGTDPKKKDSWVNIEKYISERTSASFTHGLCPDCIGKLYGDMAEKKKKKK